MAINKAQVCQITSLSPMLLRGNAYPTNNTARYEFPPNTVGTRSLWFVHSHINYNYSVLLIVPKVFANYHLLQRGKAGMRGK